MSAAAQRQRSQENAAHLLELGIWHGRKFNPPRIFPVDAPGSAAYRRLQAKRGRRR